MACRCGSGMACVWLCFVLELSTMTAEDEIPPNVAAVILAAGSSERMGKVKQLLPVRGQPMVRSVTETVCAAGFAQVIVVVGAYAGRIAPTLTGLPITIVVNKEWSQGLSTSVRAGLDAIQPTSRAAVMVLADQPMLPAELLRSLVRRYQATQAPIVAPYHAGLRSNPVLFDRSLFGELLELKGDIGARTIIARYKDAIARVEVHDAFASLDVDTPQDYTRLEDILQNDG